MLVLDPFLGSGTVGEVALRLGRDCVGIELKSEYADLARERLGSAHRGSRDELCAILGIRTPK